MCGFCYSCCRVHFMYVWQLNGADFLGSLEQNLLYKGKMLA